MKKAREYRYIAHETCDYNIGTLALIYFLMSIISSVVASAAYGIASIIVIGPLTMGFTIAIVKNYHTQRVEVGNLFDGFKNFVHNMVLGLLQGLYILLWTLLLIIPGIVKTYAYSMAYYVSLDNPELTPDQCITKSKELTDGYKWKLFCLDLSYIGWLLLCVLTLGILGFWVTPRMQTARYAFYCDLVGKPQYPVQEETPAEEKTADVWEEAAGSPEENQF